MLIAARLPVPGSFRRVARLDEELNTPGSPSWAEPRLSDNHE
jgi:hypothetical protein